MIKAQDPDQDQESAARQILAFLRRHGLDIRPEHYELGYRLIVDRDPLVIAAAQRAARESPYGRTIAHGFLTLSLLGLWYEEYLMAAMPFFSMGLNYGLDKVRFTNVVPVGSRVRGRFRLAKVEDIAGGLQLHCVVTVEIDGAAKPACVVESVVRRLAGAASSQ